MGRKLGSKNKGTRAKARSVVSKGEYKLERAGQKLARDVKKTGVYKKARKRFI